MTTSDNLFDESTFIIGDRRQGSREQQTYADVVFIWTPTAEPVVGAVCDVGPGGIGVLVESPRGLENDCEVVIDYQDTRLTGTIANAAKMDDGRTRFGIVWDESVLSKMEGTSQTRTTETESGQAHISD